MVNDYPRYSLFFFQNDGTGITYLQFFHKIQHDRIRRNLTSFLFCASDCRWNLSTCQVTSRKVPRKVLFRIIDSDFRIPKCPPLDITNTDQLYSKWRLFLSAINSTSRKRTKKWFSKLYYSDLCNCDCPFTRCNCLFALYTQCSFTETS